MIPYRSTEEKDIVLRYSDLLNDIETRDIILRDEIRSEEEAAHLANFFWKMVEASNNKDEKTGNSSEYILEKIINSFMAYFRSSGYESIWDEVSDKY